MSLYACKRIEELEEKVKNCSIPDMTELELRQMFKNLLSKRLLKVC